ncbi:YedE family putative selenium transporter [Clostridium gasigenes]|uniref:YedE family putative selenium transporter n=1 Tax=Clostridium gasigenes TaxID=94869 RepID=UPI001C0DB4F1|nr:YedE family putative selenium transporter [Clostridium gasigenes]MBU3107464.1 YedE-related selenium metabolism membrane protein [Clostridium gasigenes]
MKNKKGIILAGIIIGILAVALVKLGNPVNMGICVACFIRDTAGALGLHRAEVVQYIRPEVIGMVLGAFILAITKKEFNVRGGSSPFIRFILGFFVMIGALMFLGCPLRMMLRIAGGDLNAVVGLVGFIVGILVGVYFLNNGFTLKRSYKLTKLEGTMFPIVNVILLSLLLCAPAFILFSKEGPGSLHAPIWLALSAGLIVGALAQRTRLCTVGGIRDVVLFKDWYLLSGFVAIIVTVLIGNLFLGSFKLGFEAQAIAHTDGMWNFLGMVLVGYASVLLGGCPLRQLILAGEGNIDSVITIIGLAVGAAFVHNFGLASSAKGTTFNGRVAVIIGIVLIVGISIINSDLKLSFKKKGDVKVDIN